VRVEDDLRVRAGAEVRAARPQLAAQLDVVVDLAVVGEPETAPGQAHGLIARRGRVDDGEPAVREADVAVDPRPGPVGTAVLEARAHQHERSRVDRLARALPDSGDATHEGALDFQNVGPTTHSPGS